MNNFADLQRAAERAESYEEAQHVLALLERRRFVEELAEDVLAIKHK